MDEHLVCPRCGARNSFIKGYLPETCVCRICQSQLDWREIPGCGPGCGTRQEEPEAETAPGDGTDVAESDDPAAQAPEGAAGE
ncbi:MAG: hypothetical protein JXA87_15645 [Thermoleophilia bacterium]|nr:hypothetical protein [Thermoleophilia bacterium]